MTFSVAKDVVLFALAIYGAVLSTWNLIKAIRKDRRAVRVTVGSKMPVGVGGPLEGTAWAHVEATNVGQRPARAAAFGAPTMELYCDQLTEVKNHVVTERRPLSLGKTEILRRADRCQ